MATYYRGRYPGDTKFIVHPHYSTQAEASNEAIGHQVRLTIFFYLALTPIIFAATFLTLFADDLTNNI